MARYFSVGEAADILGTTDRTIRRMLNEGRLAGSQTTENGKMVWRVHATKDLLQRMEHKSQFPNISVDAVSVQETTFEPDAIEAENYQYADEGDDISVNPGSWRDVERDKMRQLAEEMVRPLVETIKSQTVALAEKDRIIEEQGQQLRLLPDFQRQAEEERKASELKALEVAALEKQIVAMRTQHEEAATASKKVEELEKALEQLRSEDTAKLAAKESQEAEIQKRLEAVTAELQQLRKPWWKKIFQAP